jgi:hypothetical protein
VPYKAQALRLDSSSPTIACASKPSSTNAEIGHEERPLFQADDLVPQLLETEFMPDRKPGRPDSWAGSGLLIVSIAKYSCAFSDK